MKKLYHFYDPNDSNRVYAILSKTQPINAINHICNGEIDPRYDIENDCIYDGSSDEERAEAIRPLIEEIDNHYTDLISKEMQKPMEKMFRGVISEPPLEVLEKVEALRNECNEKIAELGVDIASYRKSKRQIVTLITK